MENIEILKNLGILAAIRQRLGAEDENDTDFDDKINKMSASEIMEKWAGWYIGDESWWATMKGLYDKIEDIKNKNKKTIQVSEKMYDFLINLSKELNTQDHRHTAMPYFFQIRTDEWQFAGDGTGEEVWVGDDGIFLETEKDIINAVAEYNGWEDLPQKEINERFKKLDNWDIDDILSKNYRKVNRKRVHKYENAFLTEKAINEHIRLNKHHYSNPVSYLQYATRNSELEMLMKFLCELTGGELHK